MRSAKYLSAITAVIVFLFVLVANFSTVENRFQCSGKLARNDASIASTLYIKIAEYRWWVGLWSNSDAALWLEMPSEAVDYFSHVVEVGDQLQIFGLEKDLRGNFSTLSKILTLKTSSGFFDGKCQRIER